jgi:hypothetical protein
MMLISIDSWLWRFLEDHIYHIPPRPRTRAKEKELQVICVGMPRTATESLQRALIRLGYDHTYHGWDIMFEDPHNMHLWGKLGRRKYLGEANSLRGDTSFTRDDFDEVLGDAVAVCDAPASCFARELIELYPDAKVILNTSADMNRWHASVMKNIAGINRSWLFWVMSWTSADLFWVWNVAERILWPGLFRCIDAPGLPGNLERGIERCGKWIHAEHAAMVKGLVEKERLLEWTVLDGWEPLCVFLGKDIPDEPFPHVNDAAGFKGREKQAMGLWFTQGFANIGKAVLVVALVGVAVWYARLG